MNTGQPENTGLENLLRSALTDDLPPDVAARMQDRFDRFRENARERERQPDILAFLMPRKAWAVISSLMLMSGGMLQGLGSRSPLADRISTIESFQAVSRRLAGAESMSCSARFMQDDGSYLTYRINWRGQRGSVVLVEGPGKTILGTYEAPSSGRDSDPLISPAAPLFNPSSVAGLLSGPWRLVRFFREGQCDMGSFRVPDPGGQMDLEFTIDMCAYVPVSVRAYKGAQLQAGKNIWEARLDF